MKNISWKKKHIKTKYIYFILFFIVILLSIYLRFNNLSWETFGYSEVETWQAASEYFKGNFIHNFYTFDTPPLRRYVVFLSMMFLGTSEFSFRIISAFFGTALVIITFLMTKKFYGNVKMSLLASMITAFSIIHLQFSRYLTDDIFLSFFYIISLYFFWLYTETKSRKSYIMLGIFVGLAMVSRFMAIYLIATIVIYSIIKDHISIRIKPRFGLSIDNRLIKAFIISLIIFFIVWPFSLVSLQTDITVKVPSLDNHESSFSKNIPLFLLSAGKRISNTGIAAPPGIFEIPAISYFLAFLSKENLLIIALFLLGICYIIKNPKPVDKFILFSTLIFFIFLWLQNWGFSYRYISIIIPLISIIAAKSINLIKRNIYQLITICIIGILLFSYALFLAPSYALSYNPLNEVLNVPETEGRYSEGMKETIKFLDENCDDALGDSIIAFNILPYKENFVTRNESELTLPTCVVRNTVSNEKDRKIINDFLDSHNCTLEKRIEKSDVHLVDIFICR